MRWLTNKNTYDALNCRKNKATNSTKLVVYIAAARRNSFSARGGYTNTVYVCGGVCAVYTIYERLFAGEDCIIHACMATGYRICHAHNNAMSKILQYNTVHPNIREKVYDVIECWIGIIILYKIECIM